MQSTCTRCQLLTLLPLFSDIDTNVTTASLSWKPSFQRAYACFSFLETKFSKMRCKDISKPSYERLLIFILNHLFSSHHVQSTVLGGSCKIY